MTTLFDTRIVGEGKNAAAFIVKILQASSAYSIIGKSLDRTIPLGNEGARRLYGYEPDDVLGKANPSIQHMLDHPIQCNRYRGRDRTGVMRALGSDCT